MPTYDYECEACGHKLEAFQNISEEPLKKCPQCNKKKLKRLFGTGAGILFKGSGFYKTDYRSDSYKKRAESDKPAAGGSTESTSSGDKKSSGDSSSSSTPKSDGPSKGSSKKSDT